MATRGPYRMLYMATKVEILREVEKEGTTKQDDAREEDCSVETEATRASSHHVVYDIMTGRLLIVSSEFQPQRDRELLARLEGASHYLSTMQQAKQALPIFPQRQNIVHMERYRVVVVYGETGSGKMMQGPQFIFEEFICRGEGSACNVVVTQPRRTAAISIAKQVAQEQGKELGETVGFQVWISKQLLLSHGGLLFCTVGILLEHLKGSPKLRGISHVIVDEVHERGICTDFLLVLLQGVLKLNRNLKHSET
ncbi:ATP-dependent RNA helicase DHX30-like [Amblyomma americanum]